jgi:hypothetical protein
VLGFGFVKVAFQDFKIEGFNFQMMWFFCLYQKFKKTQFNNFFFLCQKAPPKKFVFLVNSNQILYIVIKSDEIEQINLINYQFKTWFGLDFISN